MVIAIMSVMSSSEKNKIKIALLITPVGISIAMFCFCLAVVSIFPSLYLDTYKYKSIIENCIGVSLLFASILIIYHLDKLDQLRNTEIYKKYKRIGYFDILDFLCNYTFILILITIAIIGTSYELGVFLFVTLIFNITMLLQIFTSLYSRAQYEN